jgi:hypothetical protein
MDSLKGQDKQVEETLEYLSDKYDGQKFVYESSEYLYGKLIVYCYPDGGTFKTEEVRVRREIVDGKVQYKDTYFNIIMREESEAEVEFVCADLGLTGKAFVNVFDFYIDNQFDSTKTYADYVKWDLEDGEASTRSYTLVIALDDFTDCESYADQINEGMKAKGISCTMNMYFCTNEQYEYYHNGNLDELSDIEPKIRFFRVTGLGE